MNILEIVTIDVDKLFLQNFGNKMREYFKDEMNVEFSEQFNYDFYLSSLFGEEFEVLIESNDKLNNEKRMIKILE